MPAEEGDVYDRIIASAERRAEAEHRREQAATLCEWYDNHVLIYEKGSCDCGEEP